MTIEQNRLNGKKNERCDGGRENRRVRLPGYWIALALVLGLTGCGADPVEEVPVPDPNIPVDQPPVDQEPAPDPEPVPPEPLPPEPEEPAPEEPPLTDLFDINRILEVEVLMSADDWLALSEDGRAKYEAEGTCFPGYTWFSATVTLDGETVEDVAISKKGGWGSVSDTKPSLKLDYNKGEYDDRTLQGEKNFTLNNNVQDRSLIKQCLSYSVFADAGVHAPRCNFVRITAQGMDLGIYTHVEAIKKPFLLRSFGNKSGNLYETQHDGAFIESRVPYFEKKTNEDETDRADLMAVVEAMKADDEALWEAVDQVINLDSFITFAIMEALLGHADGFTSYQNNVYIYNNPDDGRFYFIPWGTDQTFRYTYIIDRLTDSPVSVMLGSSLTRRLWQSEEFRTRYDARLREILDSVWDEEAIKARAATMANLVGTSVRDLEAITTFIDSRRAKVEAELAGEADRAGKWTVLAPALRLPEECVLDAGEE